MFVLLCFDLIPKEIWRYFSFLQLISLWQIHLNAGWIKTFVMMPNLNLSLQISSCSRFVSSFFLSLLKKLYLGFFPSILLLLLLLCFCSCFCYLLLEFYSSYFFFSCSDWLYSGLFCLKKMMLFSFASKHPIMLSIWSISNVGDMLLCCGVTFQWLVLLIAK